MKSILFTACLIFTLPLFARDSYYSPDDHRQLERGHMRDHQLLSFVKSVTNKDFRPMGYTKDMKRKLFGTVSIKRDSQGYFIKDVYCSFIIRGRKIGPGKIPTNNVMNVEHTWPQSKGSGRHPTRGDMHHLFPTDMRSNSSRGNYIFAEVDGKQPRDNCSDSQVGQVLNPRSGRPTGERGYQPPVEHRGNVARAMFYVSAKYNYDIPSTEEFYLKRWHREDPVDAEEVRRNDLIQRFQGNRNPFIDYPQLAERVEEF